jgi:hypothetical protein
MGTDILFTNLVKIAEEFNIKIESLQKYQFS